MNTTYDELWEKFKSITRVDEYEIPSTLEGIKKLVENGCDIYCQKAYDEYLTYDSEAEVLSKALNKNSISAIANAMKWQVSLNMLSEFVSVWSVYQNDTGVRDYNSQVKAKQEFADRQEKILNQLIFAICEDFGGDE